MTDDANNVIIVTLPQVNVNDDEVTLVGWRVEKGASVAVDEPLAEVETSKSVAEVPAPGAGVFQPAVHVGQVIAVGQVIGYVGPSDEAIQAYLDQASQAAEELAASQEPRGPGIEATAGAIELAQRYGLNLREIPASGKIRRADVEQFLAAHPVRREQASGATGGAEEEPLPPGLAKAVADEGSLADHQWSIARHLAATQARLVTAHVVMDVPMDGAVRWMTAQRQAGRMVGPVPLFIHAAAAAVHVMPKLAVFRLGRRTYRYKSIDIGFTARSPEGKLFTPVVRQADRRSLNELADEVSRLTMGVFRGQLNTEELSGGCLTVSALTDQPVRSHIGLQNAYQTALLTAGAVRDEVVVLHGEVAPLPMATITLSYDHGLMDGWEAAAALEAAKTALDNIDAGRPEAPAEA